MSSPNIFGGLRKMRLFSPVEPPRSNMQEIPEEEYQTPMLDRYRNIMNQYPRRENYKTPLLQKILAGVAGFSTLDPGAAVNTYRDIVDAPYNRDIDEFGRKVGVAKNLADIETESLSNRFKNKLDIAKLNVDVADKASLRDYRGVQGEELRDRMRGRSSESLDAASNRIFDRESRLIPVREASTRRLDVGRSNLTLGREKALFPLRRDLAETTHRTNRLFDIENPLPVNLMPSQEDNALSTAIKTVLLNNPEYQKFLDAGGNIKLPNPLIGSPDTAGYKLFTDKVDAERKRLIRQATNRSPLNDNGTPADAARQEAMDFLSSKGQPTTEENITWLMAQPKPW